MVIMRSSSRLKVSTCSTYSWWAISSLMGAVLRITLWGGGTRVGSARGTEEEFTGTNGGVSRTHAEDDGAQLLLGQNVGHLLQTRRQRRGGITSKTLFVLLLNRDEEWKQGKERKRWRGGRWQAAEERKGRNRTLKREAKGAKCPRLPCELQGVLSKGALTVRGQFRMSTMCSSN